MRIAVSLRIVEAQGYREPRDAISHDWIRTFDALAVTPILVPNLLADPVAFTREMGAVALLLTNGDDLGDSPRDLTEHRLLEHALAVGWPVLGVCRGFQFIAQHFGSRVGRLPEADAHAGKQHAVALSGTFADRLGRTGMIVNSYHRNGVRRDGLARGLELCAVADDVVEGFCHSSRPVWGIQWHPERPAPEAQETLTLVRAWLDLVSCGR